MALKGGNSLDSLYMLTFYLKSFWGCCIEAVPTFLTFRVLFLSLPRGASWKVSPSSTPPLRLSLY